MSRSATPGRAPKRSKAAAERVRAAGRRGVAIQADLSQPQACETLVTTTAETFGGLDILINMASVYVQKPFDDVRVEDWDAVLDVDLRAAFLCAHAAAPHMRAQGGGRIINFSDWVAKSGRPRYRGYVPYYVAKAGVIALTEALALELAGRQHSRQCHRAGTDRRAARHERRGDRRRRGSHAARTLGRRDGDRQRPCSRCSTATSSPAKPSASTAAGISNRGRVGGSGGQYADSVQAGTRRAPSSTRARRSAPCARARSRSARSPRRSPRSRLRGRSRFVRS